MSEENRALADVLSALTTGKGKTRTARKAKVFVSSDKKVGAVASVLRGKDTPTTAARKLGVSAAAVHGWIVKYKAQGWKGLGYLGPVPDVIPTPGLVSAPVARMPKAVVQPAKVSSTMTPRAATLLEMFIEEYTGARKRSE